MHRIFYFIFCMIFSLSVTAQDASTIASELSDIKQDIAKLKMRESMSGLDDDEKTKLDELLKKKEMLEKQLHK